jgi:hypothetical protein
MIKKSLKKLINLNICGRYYFFMYSVVIYYQTHFVSYNHIFIFICTFFFFAKETKQGGNMVEDHQYLVEVEVEVEDLIVLSDTSSIIQGELTHQNS